MTARQVLYLSHSESDGDALASKTITVTKPDGSALGVSLYDQVSGGSPVVAPVTNAAGIKLLYADYADLDAEVVGRVKVSYSDAPTTTFDDAFFPDPLDLFIDGMTRARTLAGGLTLSGTAGLTSSIAHATNYAGSFRNTTGRVQAVRMTLGGSGYSASFAVIFTGGGGTGAAGTATAVAGVVFGVTMTNEGSGYTSAPTVSFANGAGTGATATALVSTAAFEVKDVAGNQAFWTDGNQVIVETGKRFAVGGGPIPVDNLMIVGETITEDPALGQTVSIETNVTTGTTGDYSALRSVIRDSGNNQIHAAEIHLLSNTVGASSGGSQTRSALTLSSSVETAGANGVENVGIRLLSGVFPEITSPAPTDVGILMNYGGGSEFTNFIRCYGTDLTIRFMIETSGKVTAGEMIPRTTNTYQSGTTAARWLAVCAQFLNTAGNHGGSAFSGPAIVDNQDTTTGIGFPAAGEVGAGVSGVMGWYQTVAGLDIGGRSNGQVLGIRTLTELTTIAAAATTDTTILMPANSIVLGISVRVTVVIPTAATFTVGDSGSAARFSTAAVSVAAGSTDPGTKAGAYYNASALAIRFTPNASPGNNSGRVRTTIHYLVVTPATS